jgi:hypothetical protein
MRMKPESRTGESRGCDSRHFPVAQEIWRVYNEENHLTCPWSGKHAKILARTLATARNWEAKRWHDAILNRFASEGVNAAEDPAVWIPYLISYARGPLNRFGKTDRVPAECYAKLRALSARYAAAQHSSGSAEL